jgi:hypothetical protein
MDSQTVTPIGDFAGTGSGVRLKQGVLRLYDLEIDDGDKLFISEFGW